MYAQERWEVTSSRNAALCGVWITAQKPRRSSSTLLSAERVAARPWQCADEHHGVLNFNFNTAFATRCSKKAKSWRNGHKMGPSGATRQQGLTGGVGGGGLVHNTRVQPLVCTVSPANTLATPIPLRLTADAIMQDLHQTGCSRPAWSWGAAGLLPTPSL